MGNQNLNNKVNDILIRYLKKVKFNVKKVNDIKILNKDWMALFSCTTFPHQLHPNLGPRWDTFFFAIDVQIVYATCFDEWDASICEAKRVFQCDCVVLLDLLRSMILDEKKTPWRTAGPST